jgi:hypothetical protein
MGGTPRGMPNALLSSVPTIKARQRRVPYKTVSSKRKGVAHENVIFPQDAGRLTERADSVCSPLLATKRVAWMTAFRVVQRRSVSYLDASMEPQLHKPNRLWQPEGLTGDSPDARP